MPSFPNATHAKINWDQVLRIASTMKGQSCKFDGRELFGGSNFVYCLVFEDGTRWALRVHRYYHGASVAPPSPFERTVTTMRYTKNAVPSIPIASVHAWSDSEDGDGVGTPYMLLDWIKGRTLSEWSTNSPPEPAREKVLFQLARFTVDLVTRTLEQPSTQSSLAWMLMRIDTKLWRILTGDLADFDPVDCLIYRAMAEEKYHIPSLDGHPFPLMHADLSKFNVIVDEEFNITGILDWDDLACRLPLQSAVMYPAMIAVVNDSSENLLFRKDRLAFIKAFTSAIEASGLAEDIMTRLSSILSDTELQTFHASIKSKGVYPDWVTKYCTRTEHWVKAAMKALDKFLLANKQMADSPEILNVRLRLKDMKGEEYRFDAAPRSHKALFP